MLERSWPTSKDCVPSRPESPTLIEERACDAPSVDDRLNAGEAR
jgi:hypothetical protein